MPRLITSRATEPKRYLADLDALGTERWDGSADSAARLELEDGGVVLYNIFATDAAVELSVFISSGTRPNVSNDQGQDYRGPSAIFTCYGINADFSIGAESEMHKTTFDECPAALVDAMPEDAAFASGEVFDG